MKLAIAQINPTVGDFHENHKKIESAISSAKSRGADLILFSEQVVGGYPARDLVEKTQFIKANTAVLESLKPLSKDICIVIGLVSPSTEEAGHRVQNSAAVLQNGKILGIYAKRLLPTYDVFDEHRYFFPGNSPLVFEHCGKKIGVSICEDIWNPEMFWEIPRYQHDPIQDLVKAGAELILNCSASPYSFGHDIIRNRIVGHHAKLHKVPIALCNQIGANDDLIFDGQSIVVDSNGAIIAHGLPFQEDFFIIDPFLSKPEPARPQLTDIEKLLKALVLGIRDYVGKCGFSDVLIGLSGGIDSAVTASLSVLALGKEHVKGILMPSQFSTEGSIKDSLDLAKHLDIKTEEIGIQDIYELYLKDLKPSFDELPFDTAEENIQARIRGNLLMALSNKFNALVISTGNKSEIAVGYCTLYGDLSGGLAAISDVPKTLVYALAKEINRENNWISEKILKKHPSAELKPNQKDQDTLPPYDILDAILKRYIEEGEHIEEIVKTGYDRKLVEKIVSLVDRNEYKRRQTPIGLRVTSKAFGSGRRMPIANKFKG